MSLHFADHCFLLHLSTARQQNMVRLNESMHDILNFIDPLELKDQDAGHDLHELVPSNKECGPHK